MENRLRESNLRKISKIFRLERLNIIKNKVLKEMTVKKWYQYIKFNKSKLILIAYNLQWKQFQNKRIWVKLKDLTYPLNQIYLMKTKRSLVGWSIWTTNWKSLRFSHLLSRKRINSIKYHHKKLRNQFPKRKMTLALSYLTPINQTSVMKNPFERLHK